MVKFSFLTLGLLALSAASFADVSLGHQKFCKSDAVKKTMGAKGTCRIAIVQKKKEEKVGKCTGKLEGVLPCEVSYSSKLDGSPDVMNVTCGADAANPAVQEESPAEVQNYEVVAVVKDRAGKRSLVKDPRNYLIISSDLATIFRNFGKDDLIFFNLSDDRLQLSDVNCI